MTLNAAFIQVFGEALEPLGFKKIKGRQSYFVRLIGNEIAHIISCRKSKGHPAVNGVIRPDYGRYEIIGGVATVYRPKIDLSIAPKDMGWLLSDSEIYTKLHAFDLDMQYRKEIMYFPYKPDDENQMLESFRHAFDITSRNLLSVINEATNLNACMDFFYKYNLPLSFIYGGGFNENDSSEGLLQLKIDSFDSCFEREEGYLKLEIDIDEHWCKKGCGGYTQEGIDLRRREFEKGVSSRRNQILAWFSDTDWLNKAHEELERRKAANTEILRSYGLEL